MAEVGGARYLAQLAAAVVTVVDAQGYAEVLRDLSLRRQLIGFGETVVNDAYRHDIDREAAQLARLHAALHRDDVVEGRMDLAGDQRRDQAVDQHGQPHLGDALQPLHHRVEVLRQPRQGFGQLLGEASRFVELVDPLPEGVLQALERLADGLRQLGVLAGELVLLR
ncbi:MAG: hypothetical protein ACK40C_14555, partial [Novosphingobium meiothermophilum]